MGNSPSSKSKAQDRDHESMLTCRLADDGYFYSEEEFRAHYGGDFENRWAQAPRYMERRKSIASSDKYQDARFWYDKYGKGDNWRNNSKPGWDGAVVEKKLADDGKWYTLAEFQEYYPSDWERRFLAAPSDDERRFHNGAPQDAKFFFDENERSGGNNWSLNSKPLWETAVEAPGASASPFEKFMSQTVQAFKERRLADDGSFYTRDEFEKYYTGDDLDNRWTWAPKETDKKFCDIVGMNMDPLYFYNRNKKEGGENWSKKQKTLWDDAPAAVIPNGKHLADDGQWYTRDEFMKYYPSDYATRFEKAPRHGEFRIGPDGKAHDGEWFFNENKRMYGESGAWSFNRKGGWDEGKPVGYAANIPAGGQYYGSYGA